MTTLPVPEKLNIKTGNIRKNWQLFRQTWKNYETATKLSSNTNEQRIATLLTVIGQNALEVYNTFQFNEAEETTIDNVLDKFENYCVPQSNLTFERYKLFSRKQNSAESIDEYVTCLKGLASSCEFGEISNSLVKDAMVLGVHDEKLRETLLRELKLSLEKAISIARAAENAKFQSTHIDKQENGVETLNKVKHYKANNKSNITDVIKCKFCGRNHERNKFKCPAFGKKCSKCSKDNHFATQCFSKQSYENNIKKVSSEVLTDSSDEENELWIE